MDIKKLIKEELNDFEWARDIIEPIVLSVPYKYYIPLCDTGYKVRDIRDKFIELFGTDYSGRWGVVNWFGNDTLERTEEEDGGVILYLTHEDLYGYEHPRGVWDRCDVDHTELIGYDRLDVHQFLTMVKK